MGIRFLKKIPFEPTFFLLLIYLIITNGIFFVFNFIAVCFVHEFSHTFVAKKLGYKVENFVLAPHGASINFKQEIFVNNDEIKIAVAGPISNLICAVTMVSFWWIFPNLYNLTYLFVLQSYFFAMFNLLPCYPLDGGRVLTACLQNYISREKAIKISCILNFIFSIVFFLLFIVSCFIDFNPTFATVSVFLLLSFFINSSQSKFCLVNRLNKINKNFSKVKFIYIKKSTLLSKLINKVDQNKFTIFVISDKRTIFLDEQKVFNFSKQYPLTMTIGEILDQIWHK